MNNKNRLGNNIRIFRKALGETQEELGVVLNVSKNAVSNYEKGTREPDNATIYKIAEHYGISTEELLNTDYSELDGIKIKYDNNLFWKKIDEMFPIEFTDEAFRNGNFKKACLLHYEIYENLKKQNLETNNISLCLSEYEEAYKDEKSKREAGVNILSIWYLFMFLIKATPRVLEIKPASLMQAYKEDKNVRRIIDDCEEDKSIIEMKKVLEELSKQEIWDYADEIKKELKKSFNYSEIADYYIALEYMLNLVNNSLEFEMNQCIGREMMNAFLNVGNVYAARFILNSLEISGISSRTVDDK